jgi:hypothetical protein
MGHSSDHGDIRRVRPDILKLATPNVTKPVAMSQRLSILLVNTPTIGARREGPVVVAPSRKDNGDTEKYRG